MRVWYNPITDKPASTLPTLAVAEPVEERRAGRGGPCARIGSRRGPLAWACLVSCNHCNEYRKDVLDEVDGIGKVLGRSLSSLGVVRLHANLVRKDSK